jgi:hypothetical protein
MRSSGLPFEGKFQAGTENLPVPRIREPPPAPDYVFMLGTPSDVLHKLYWELAQLKKALVVEPEKIGFTHAPAYHAFNFSVTAWHLADWVWEASTPQLREELLRRLGKTCTGRRGKDFQCFQTAIREKCRSIHICRQLATGSKHMTVREHPDPTVRAEMRWNLEEPAADAVGACEQLVKYRYQLVIWDDDVPRPAVEIFEDALRGWKRFLQDWGFEEARFIGGQPLGQP